MLDFRLKVFHSAANRLSFTKAAEELYISQPAVSKNIKELEIFYKTTLFDRIGSKLRLTKAGEILLSRTEEILKQYRIIEYEISELKSQKNGELRIGASTTIAQYVLPIALAKFKRNFPNVSISLISGNTEQIELALIDKKIDLGAIEGGSKRSELKYIEFKKDRILLTAATNNILSKKVIINNEDLKNIPFVFREFGSGTLEVITSALKGIGINIEELNKEIELNASESIKRYLKQSNAAAFLSIFTIEEDLKNNSLTALKVQGLDIERLFYFIIPQGENESLSEIFINFYLRDNF